jgi:hypothetical protein
MRIMTEKINASQYPKIFYCRHMNVGLARYEDETILVDTDGMLNLLKTGEGIPVFILHQNVDLANIKEQAAGYVTDSFYNQYDGWGWFKFLAVDDAAHAAIKKGWSVSNAYMPSQWGAGGMRNNVPYDRVLNDGYFTHLAIVPDPRYEGARILTPDEYRDYNEKQKLKHAELQNSTTKEQPIMKFFNLKKEATTTIDENTMAELADGSTVKVSEMVNALTKAKEVEATVEVNGKKMTIDELATAYSKLGKENTKKAKKNEKDEDEDMENAEDLEMEEEGDDEIGDDKKASAKKNKKNKKNGKKNEMDDCDMENAEDEDKDDKKDKKNSKCDDSKVVDTNLVDDKFFNELRNANQQVEQRSAPLISTSVDAIQRGKEKYGSGK